MASINTNMSATIAVSNLNKASDEMTSVLTAMSSGKRINSASDDASGLAVHTSMSVDHAAWEQAAANADIASSILQTADGGLAEIADILERAFELASQAASGSVNDQQRGYLDTEYQELLKQINATVASATYSGTPLLNGTYDQSFVVSADGAAGVIGVKIPQKYDAVGLDLKSDLTSAVNATAEMAKIDLAIGVVSGGRATVGALQSRFDYAAGNIETAKTNLEAAMGVYMDADIAELSADQTELGVKMDSAIQALSVSNDNLEKLSRLLS